MPANYVLLEKITVGAAGASSVTFSGIPQTGYTDLVVKLTTRTNNTSPNIFFSINGSTSTFSSVALYGDGASASSTSGVPRIVSYTSFSTDTSNTFGNTEVYIPNYTSSNYKSYSVDTVGENNATTAYSGLFAGLWSTTSAITSLTFTPASSGSFVANSTFYLYGVAKLGTTPTIAPKAAGGDIVMTDGTYWYHAFRSSGTFTPATNLSCDVLVLAGGGGGGGAPFNQTSTGGGGAGGLLLHSATSVTANTGLTVTVGAGGAGGSGNTGTTGSNSVFGSLTAASGGGRGGAASGNGGNGGSGGGGGTGADGGLGTSGQGNNGGSGNSGNSGHYAGGGGGGAGAVGQAAQPVGTYGSGGNGGAGSNTYSSWLSVTGTGVSGYIAGGGGGGAPSGGGTAGAGGAGGGGAGVVNTATPAVSATANTGSGGGGTGYGANPGPAVGGAGGSGLVIVRYLVA